MTAAYYQFSPSKCCKAVVEEIRVQESPEEPDARPTTILPSGRIQLVIHYGDPFLLVTDTESREMTSSHIVGQPHSPVSVKATGKTGIIILRFYPCSASALIPQSLAKFTDSFIELSDVWPDAIVTELHTSVNAASTPDQRAAAADSFLCSAIGETRPDLACKSSIDLMNTNWGRRQKASIAEQPGLSRRHSADDFPVAQEHRQRRCRDYYAHKKQLLVFETAGMCTML